MLVDEPPARLVSAPDRGQSWSHERGNLSRWQERGLKESKVVIEGVLRASHSLSLSARWRRACERGWSDGVDRHMLAARGGNLRGRSRILPWELGGLVLVMTSAMVSEWKLAQKPASLSCISCFFPLCSGPGVMPVEVAGVRVAILEVTRRVSMGCLGTAVTVLQLYFSSARVSR